MLSEQAGLTAAPSSVAGGGFGGDAPAGRPRVLYMCLAVSLLLHAVLLSIHFRVPDRLRQQAGVALDVILVNARTRERPVQAEARAQADLDGGGNTDANRRARTPLPVTKADSAGQDLAQARRRPRQDEAPQRELMTRPRDTATPLPASSERASPERQSTPEASGRDLADLSLATMRLQAQVDRQLDEYQKRPRRKFIGARASEYRFAQYEEDWRLKVERFGTLNYPPEARGRTYGSLRLTVTLRPDGNVESVELDRSSGLKVLDEAAFRIVRMAAPYAPFPADIRKDTDLLVITRTWFFTQGDRIRTE